MIKATQTIPLTEWEDGTIRIEGSRVTLDSIVRLFKSGETADQIQYSYPSLTLREIYGAIYYYLENSGLMEDYLLKQQKVAEESREFIDSHFNSAPLRERIKTRRAQLIKK
ncbi:MAG TPA: DUF433 domain-containing protein [Blastocatellia bacterium]|nr:DUF433 domain-containing protein [Blastocatellia bacterium]